jgi:hypothetical protein
MILGAIGAASLLSALAAETRPSDILLGKPLLRFVEFEHTAWPTDRESWSSPKAQRFLAGLKVLAKVPHQEGILMAAGPDAVVLVYRTDPHTKTDSGEGVFGRFWMWSAPLSRPVPWEGAPIPGVLEASWPIAHEMLIAAYRRGNIRLEALNHATRLLGPLYDATAHIPQMRRNYYLRYTGNVEGFDHEASVNDVFHTIANRVQRMVEFANERDRKPLGIAENMAATRWRSSFTKHVDDAPTRHFALSVIQDMSREGLLRDAHAGETEQLFRRRSPVAVAQGVWKEFERRYAKGHWGGTYSILNAWREYVDEGGNVYPEGHPSHEPFARVMELP